MGGKEAWVIGTNFLRGFYTIFDMDQKKIGFAVIKGGKKLSPYFATNSGRRTPEDEIENRNLLAWVLVLLSFLLAGGIVAASYV